MKVCIRCSKEINRWASKYCSNTCQRDQQYFEYIKKWQTGTIAYSEVMSHHIIRYIHLKYRAACALCCWNKMNPYSHRSVLEIDHIDGNPQNHNETNLILLCPNCHSLTKTYKNLNKGHGRLSRRKKYDKILRMPL